MHLWINVTIRIAVALCELFIHEMRAGHKPYLYSPFFALILDY